MQTLFGLDVVVDDDLHARAAAEGTGLEDEDDLFCWLAEQARETAVGRSCGCERRGLCCLDHRTGLPRPPEQRRLEREARSWGYQHTWAQTWP